MVSLQLVAHILWLLIQLVAHSWFMISGESKLSEMDSGVLGNFDERE